MPKYNEIRVKENNSNLLSAFAHETSDLVSVNNNQVVTTSIQVAEFFQRPHKDVLASIRNLECSSGFRERNFSPSCYYRKNGNVTSKYPMYYLTKDGFVILAMGFTGKVAARFKEAYINAFNEMEERLRGVTVKEEDIATYLRSLCEDMDTRMKGHEKQLQKQYGSTPNPGMVSPALFCTGSLKEQLDYIFKALNNDILAGQFAWAKLQQVERENEEMKKTLAKAANEFLNYYY